jgi:hypothetical protein
MTYCPTVECAYLCFEHVNITERERRERALLTKESENFPRLFSLVHHHEDLQSRSV